MSNFQNFFNKKYVYAIVGATNNKEKYGYKIFKTLVDAGFNVIPINPNEKSVMAHNCYESLFDVPDVIDVVDFVVPAGVTIKVLEEVADLGIDKVWFQPGSSDAKCEKFAYQNGIDYLKDFCLLKAALSNGDIFESKVESKVENKEK